MTTYHALPVTRCALEAISGYVFRKIPICVAQAQPQEERGEMERESEARERERERHHRDKESSEQVVPCVAM